MKTFVKENWYKLMVGTSMLMASFGFMIYAISPAYSNSNSEKTEIINTNAPLGSNGVIIGEDVFFVDGGYVYKCAGMARRSYNAEYITNWRKYKLP